MMRALVISFAALLGASCAQQPATSAAANLPACGENGSPNGELLESECQMQATGETLHVKFAALAAGVQSGTVSVDVLGENGAVSQTLVEPEVSEYLAPTIEDVDGDGHGDVLIARESGNVNVAWGVWIFNRERGRYERVGDVSGVEIQRTSDGYIAVPARSGAAEWNVAFYRLDESALAPLVTVNIEATDVTEDGHVTRQTCTIEDAPGLTTLHLTRDAARAKFCAEPAAEVFAQ